MKGGNMRALYWLLLFCMRSQCLASHVTVDQRDDVKENATVDDYDFDPLNATVAESFLENKLPNLPRDSGRLRGGGLISSLRAVISSLSSDAEITHTAYPAEEGGNNNEASGSGTLESEVVQVDVSLEGVNVVLSNQDVQNAEIPGGVETDVGSHQVDDKVDDSSAGCSFDFHQPLETVDTVHVHDCGQDDVSPGICIIGTLGPQNQQTASPV
ncbi:hypothetical protein CYMTET_11016 [Cymbomonas tetramitiformis]|uniref:Uncharacterized protein n=1 Tax=Cymbomonas tetramitiformis TaxID=36881 RepID=A0AAE0LDW4_9CHLO|nr:hypothetical protein CYMTET_11016 [Cymbomonas tetramitiformis]